MISIESPPRIEVPKQPVEPDPEYAQTAVVSFDGLAGRALAKFLKGLGQEIRSGQADESGNDRLVAVVPTRHTGLKQVHAAGFRTAEIDSGNQLIGLELIPESHRPRPVRVDMNLEIILNT